MKNLIPLTGYTILSIVYLIFVTINLNEDNKLHLFGSIIIFIGYSSLVYEHINKKKEEKNEFSYGHLILFLFYSLSFILPINHHFQNFDIIASIGHGILINSHNIYGKISMLLYLFG